MRCGTGRSGCGAPSGAEQRLRQKPRGEQRRCAALREAALLQAGCRSPSGAGPGCGAAAASPVPSLGTELHAAPRPTQRPAQRSSAAAQ